MNMLLKSRFFKIAVLVVLITFSNVVLQPAIAALNTAKQAPSVVQTKTAMERYSKVLDHMRALTNGHYRSAGLRREKAKALAAHPEDAPATVLELSRQMESMESDVDAQWQATEDHLNKHKISREILDRHYTLQKRFKEKQAELKGLISAVEVAFRQGGGSVVNSAAYQQLAKFLKEAHPAAKNHFDPKKLPWRSPSSKVRKPIQDPQKLKDFLANQAKKAAIAQPKSLLAAKDIDSWMAAELGYPDILQSPAAKAASWLSDALATPAFAQDTPPTPDYLSPTIDVQITPAIIAQANALNKNPIAIYEWVRNNIKFIPTYGSIKGSDMTLQMGQGNAFDISSLLIALLRASGIPARYVYGTIEVPVDQAMNWVGGVTNVGALQQVLGQGGIPNTAISLNGQITTIRLEHVWVEAWVNNAPSRGARNILGNAWIPLDASFKQYTYTQGIDFAKNVPFDAQGFVNGMEQGATINDQQGWFQNPNQTNTSNQLNSYVTQLTSYVTQNKPNATFADVFGGETIVNQNFPILLGTLPYKVDSTADTYSVLPDSLRQKFTYILDGAWTYTEWLPNLAGKKVMLSFMPATQADLDVITSYLPKPHSDGTPIQPSELPRSLPACINVTPQLSVDGNVVATGGIFSLGTALSGHGGFMLNDLSGWDMSDDGSLIAGQATAIGLSIQGMSPTAMQNLENRMSQVKTDLQANDLTGLNTVGLAGDLLTSCIWGYFAQSETFRRAIQVQAGMIDIPGLSYGLFEAATVPLQTFYGVTTSVSCGGLEMDVGHLRYISVAKDDNNDTMVNYNRQVGEYSSYLEAAAPVNFFKDATHPGEGISAVTAISQAAGQGQKIFTITQANEAVALPQISQSDSVMQDIENALAQGLEVTVPAGPITTSDGWTGTGYIIIDPQTGAGSYLIEGGANGGFFSLPSLSGLPFWLVVILIIAGGLVAGFAITFAIAALVSAAETIVVADIVAAIAEALFALSIYAYQVLLSLFALTADILKYFTPVFFKALGGAYLAFLLGHGWTLTPTGLLISMLMTVLYDILTRYLGISLVPLYCLLMRKRLAFPTGSRLRLDLCFTGNSRNEHIRRIITFYRRLPREVGLNDWSQGCPVPA